MTQTNNFDTIITEGFEKARLAIYMQIEQKLNAIAKEYAQYGVHVWQREVNSGKVSNLTGNTVTSFASAVYMWGEVSTFYFAGEIMGMKPPIRVKFQRGEVAFDFMDYDGNERMFAGGFPVITDGGYGPDWSYKFLASYPFPKTQCGIVVTTGTEYSEFLFKERDVDILFTTYHQSARPLAELTWKTIKV